MPLFTDSACLRASPDLPSQMSLCSFAGFAAAFEAAAETTRENTVGSHAKNVRR